MTAVSEDSPEVAMCREFLQAHPEGWNWDHLNRFKPSAGNEAWYAFHKSCTRHTSEGRETDYSKIWSMMCRAGYKPVDIHPTAFREVTNIKGKTVRVSEIDIAMCREFLTRCKDGKPDRRFMWAFRPTCCDPDHWRVFTSKEFDYNAAALWLAGCRDFGDFKREVSDCITKGTWILERTADEDDDDDDDGSDIVKDACVQLQQTHHFATVEETGEILYYVRGVYISGGEAIIDKDAEAMFGYELSNHIVSEIKGHIRRSTCRKQEEFDCDLNIVNVSNGLYDISADQLCEHNPSYLSRMQAPIKYVKGAKPQLLGKFLSEVLYPAQVRTLVELTAYTFHRANPFELYVVLLGVGANGKTVFMHVLTELHGKKNVSNASVKTLMNNRFAAADLENKNVNIDKELASATITDMAVLKELTGAEPVRIERKNKPAYDATLHAKLFVSTNEMPAFMDETDGGVRREYIVSFPNQFEGKNDDPDLKFKLTTEAELSGMFNVCMQALRRILKEKKIHVDAATIRDKRQRRAMASDPIRAFMEQAVAQDSVETDYVRKEDLWEAYRKFCKYHKLQVESYDTFCKKIKNRYKYAEGRDRTPERKTIWKGVRLAEWTNTDQHQDVLAT